jgi:hypothetical protein
LAGSPVSNDDTLIIYHVEGGRVGLTRRAAQGDGAATPDAAVPDAPPGGAKPLWRAPVVRELPGGEAATHRAELPKLRKMRRR